MDRSDPKTPGTTAATGSLGDRVYRALKEDILAARVGRDKALARRREIGLGGRVPIPLEVRAAQHDGGRIGLIRTRPRLLRGGNGRVVLLLVVELAGAHEGVLRGGPQHQHGGDGDPGALQGHRWQQISAHQPQAQTAAAGRTRRWQFLPEHPAAV